MNIVFVITCPADLVAHEAKQSKIMVKTKLMIVTSYDNKSLNNQFSSRCALNSNCVCYVVGMSIETLFDM